MNLLLFGFKKCGKTYFGKKLAEALQQRFIDTDQRIEEVYAIMTGEFLTFREIYKKLGKELFRLLETHVIEGLRGMDHAVIALGGGAILDPKNRLLLEKLGTLVYLKIDKATLKQRLSSGPLPLYFDGNDFESSFEKMYQERLPIYERVHSLWVDAAHKTDAEVLLQLTEIARLKRNYGK